METGERQFPAFKTKSPNLYLKGMVLGPALKQNPISPKTNSAIQSNSSTRNRLLQWMTHQPGFSFR